MPNFAPGAEVWARIAISNLQPLDLVCDVNLFLGSEDVAQFKAATIRSNSTTELQILVVMPSVPGTYPVLIKITFGGVLIGAYPAEDVTVIIGLTGQAEYQLDVLVGQGFITYVTPDTYKLMNFLAEYAYYEHIYVSTGHYLQEWQAAFAAATAEINNLGMPGYAIRHYPGVAIPVGVVKVDDVRIYDPKVYKGEFLFDGVIIFPYHYHIGYYYWQVVDERLVDYHPFQTRF